MRPTDGYVPMTESNAYRAARCQLALAVGLGVFALLGRWALAEPPMRTVDTSWGSDHVGKPVPEYMSGDECLFCHREVIGPTWGEDPHGQTVRRIKPTAPGLKALAGNAAFKAFAPQVEYLLGRGQRQRFLKRGQGYGELALLSAHWVPPQGDTAAHLTNTDQPHWDAKHFGQACAGCHATGVDTKTKRFAALSLDCFVCHGQVPDAHTEKPELAYFAAMSEAPARETVAICAQCHIRTGTSKSTGLPYPNNFVPGDNLFRDFQVDLSEEAIKRLNPGDAHVLHNVRDVMVLGKTKVTCVSCHLVHDPSTFEHRRVAESTICLHCHPPDSKRKTIPYQVHSKRCEY